MFLPSKFILLNHALSIHYRLVHASFEQFIYKKSSTKVTKFQSHECLFEDFFNEYQPKMICNSPSKTKIIIARSFENSFL